MLVFRSFGDDVTEALNIRDLLTKKTTSVLLKRHTTSAQSALKQTPFQLGEEAGFVPTVGELVIKFRAGDWVVCVLSNFVHFLETVHGAKIYSISFSKTQRERGFIDSSYTIGKIAKTWIYSKLRYSQHRGDP